MPKSYDNPWKYEDKVFDSEDIGKYAGFVYIIRNRESGKEYVGRKYFHSIRKVKGKARRQRSESDWKQYYGSSPELDKECEKHGKAAFQREIISLHTTRGRVNYEEVREQFKRDVLENERYVNETISGKYFRPKDHISSKSQYAANSSGRALKSRAC